MNSLRQKIAQALVLVCIASTILWASGCVGVGKPSNLVVSSITVAPAVASPSAGAKIQFAAAIQGTTTNNSVTWSASIGAITSAGMFTAPAARGTGTITATSVADPTKSATATVTISTGSGQSSSAGVTSVTVSPTTASSVTSGTLQFSAAVQGTASNTSVTWKAKLGSIASAGVYTAPAKTGTDTVTATSAADPTQSASANITITAASGNSVVTSIAITPTTAHVATSGTFQFASTVQGTVTDKSVRWTAVLGAVNSSGFYTASAQAGSDTVTAISNADSTKTAVASVTVAAPVASGLPPSADEAAWLWK